MDIVSFNVDCELCEPLDYAPQDISEKHSAPIKPRHEQLDVHADKLMSLIKASGFGYLPLETLGEGDPKTKIAALHKKFSQTVNE